MKKILIIDDEPDFCNLVITRLKAQGYDAFAANAGESGVLLAKEKAPDIILMDIMMPEMSGGDAVRLLKDDPLTACIPVIFLTAVVSKEEEGSEQVNIDNAFYPAIAKPFEPDEFLAKLKEVLGE